MKVLSTTWDMNSDSLFISGCDISASPVTTKREALQFMSKIYDPLGFLSSVTLNGKLFIQELWQQELDWDETLNSSQQDKWCKLHEDLLPLSSLPIPRYIGRDDFKLFCFSDASAKVYSTAVYLYFTVGGTANVNLIFFKARVAPAKRLSIPRIRTVSCSYWSWSSQLCGQSTPGSCDRPYSVERLPVCPTLDEKPQTITHIPSKQAERNILKQRYQIQVHQHKPESC